MVMQSLLNYYKSLSDLVCLCECVRVCVYAYVCVRVCVCIPTCHRHDHVNDSMVAMGFVLSTMCFTLYVFT